MYRQSQINTMANIWNLKIKVVDAQDAEKMKDCVRELS